MKEEFKTDEDIAAEEFENSLEQYATYSKVDVEHVTIDLTTKAKNLIDGVARIYSSIGSSIDEDFIKSIKQIETDQLVSMLKQVKYAEHMLDTLMNRLDNGGYVDKDIYLQIQDMQNHVIKMNLEVSKYTRMIPEFFKFTESDVQGIQQRQIVDYQNSSKTIDSYAEEVKKKVSSNSPQRGTKGFLEALDLEDSLSAIEDVLSAEPEIDLTFDPKDITEDNFDDEEA
jgi:hypothetical protein